MVAVVALLEVPSDFLPALEAEQTSYPKGRESQTLASAVD